jgi:hypothetical protein
MLKWPPRFSSRRRAKIDGESKRGQHSQSIDPSREMRATERVSPMTA